MELSFEQLKSMVIFARVVEKGSFSQAAKHLGLSRAVVSYHIKKLESQHGVKLLNRSTRSMALTEAGTSYYERCRIISEQASFAQQQMENLKNKPEGLLKITCPVNVGLELIVPALNEFKHLYPKIELELKLSDDIVNILDEGMDLAIRGAPLVSSELQATRLATLSTLLCAAPGYLQKYGRPNCPAQLADHQWVLYKQSKTTLELKKGNRHHNIQLISNISTNNAAARTAFVEGGHGLGRIPFYDAWPRIQAGKLETLLTDYQMEDIFMYAVFPPGSASSKKMRLVIDYLKSYFARLQNQQRLTA